MADDSGAQQHDLQPALLDVEADVLEAQTRSGHYTGETWARLHPEMARTALELRARGMGLKAIARTCGCSVNTIMAWVERRAPDVETIKQGLASRSRTIAGMCLEQIAEDLEAGKLRGDRAAVTFGILVDKSQLLDGQATSIVHRAGDGDPHKGFADFLDSLPEAKAREIPPETGREGGERGQTREAGPAGAAAGPASEEADRPGLETGADGSGIRCFPEAEPAFDPGFDPTAGRSGHDDEDHDHDHDETRR